MMTYEQRYEYVMDRCAEISAQRKKRRNTAAGIVIPISAVAVVTGVFAGFLGLYPLPVDKVDSTISTGVILSALNSRNSDPAESSEINKTLSPEEWGKLPHVLPSKFAPDDFDFVNTTNGHPGSYNTTIYAEWGSDVYAVDDGEVIYANYDVAWNSGYGCVVVIKHGEGLFTIYSHLLYAEESGREFVSIGDKVKAGQCIGFAGTSGQVSNCGLSYSFQTELPEFFKDKNLCS